MVPQRGQRMQADHRVEGVAEDFVRFFQRMARTLAQLEKKGLIRREVNQEDKRTATVFLTERAHDLYPQIMSVIKVWDDAVTEVFSVQDKETLLELMQRLAGRAAELRDATPTALIK